MDEKAYPIGYEPPAEWLAEWQAAQPGLLGKTVLLMPGRLTRWKGQEDFLQLIAALAGQGMPVHGLIVGDPHPKKLAFLDELKALAETLGISEKVSFLGHRGDLREIMAVSDLVYSFSRDPEAFGRVSLEAMALGKPVIAYNHGGVAEQLQALFPQGLVPVGDVHCAIDLTGKILNGRPKPLPIDAFTLDRMLDATLDVYQSLPARTAPR